MRKIYKIPLILLTLFCSFSAFAQKSFFTDVSETALKAGKEIQTIKPIKFRGVSLNNAALKTFLWSLPSEKNVYNRKAAPVLEIPLPDGRTGRFNVWESSIQEPGLEAKFPEIKTFAGQGIDDPYATIRFDYNPYSGFHAQILSVVSGRIYIDPYAKGNINNYISYFHSDNQRHPQFGCSTPDPLEDLIRPESTLAGPCRGTQLTTYRFAFTCTGEYAAIVGGGAAGPTHAAIVTSTNRITQVYEVELAIRLVLIANNNLVEFLNPATDPFANDGSIAELNIITGVINGAVGAGSYDVGHLACTASNAGVAGLGVVCTGSKGRGLTGGLNPVGDGYDIDYLAHELGHQFNAQHTFNSNNCASPGASFEPGSGTTIMAYAGICAPTENIQPNSDPIFHAKSFDDISTFLASGSGSFCGVSTATSNTLPVIAPLTNNNVSIPINTPFTLTGSATDANGDALTYNWEGWDAGAAGSWPSAATSTTRALFRTRVSKITGSRTFPDIRVIAANYPGTGAPSAMDGLRGEVLPQVARVMKFRLTVRDNRAGGGGVVSSGDGCQDTAPFIVNAVGTAPFAVTIPNGGESYSGGSSQNITWNVVGTNAAPFNVTNVRISYSTDGGLTYPTVLSASTLNDGTESLTIPVGATTTARVRVEAIGNIFFDISNANFTVTVPVNDFAFGATTASTITCPAPTDPTVTIPTSVTGTFTTPIVLAATAGVPIGTTVTFAPNPLTPGSSTVATLNNAAILANGTYNITVTGTAGSSVKNTTITYIITAGAGPTLTAVANQTVCAPATATFSVSTVASPVTYQWQSAPTVGGTYTNITGATNATYTTGATSAAMNGMGFRCIVSTQCGSTTSNNALLTVNTSAAITTQPTNQPSCTGNTATFTGAASGLGVTYQWQSSTTGIAGSFTNIPGATSASYTTPVITGATPGFYQLVATTTTCPGTATSNVAQLTISVTAAIGTQPTAQTVCAPATATFSVAATGSGLSYQWQVATAAAPTVFTNVGTNANSFTTGATSPAMNGNIYRVVVTGSCNAVTSSNATLTVNNVASVSTQPTAQIVCNGSTATFTVVGAGSGTLSYQWQSGPSATGPFTNVSTGTGATTTSYTTGATIPAMSGSFYQVVINSATCPGAATSTPVLLTVNTLAVIATQPTAQTVCKTQTATFVVAAVIVPGLTYQWQSAPTSTGTFTNITGATSPSYITPATVLADDGKFYRVNITGTCSATPTTSNAVRLTVNDPISITAGPQLQSGCVGDNFTFSVTAVGGTFYQWQSSPTGLPGTFTNIAGASGPSLTSYTITGAPLFLNGTFYRVFGTVLCGAGISSDTSTSARLVLSNRSAVVLTAPATSTNNPAVNSMIFATVSPANANVLYTWKRNGVIIPNTLGATSITLNVDDAATYEVTITDISTQCQSVSNKITTLASTSDNLLKDRIFVYPNPVRSIMQIRFNNSTSTDRATMVNIYDEKGARVFAKSYIVNNTFGRMDVDMSRMQNGVYMIYLMDKNGKRLAGSKVVKLN